LTVLKGVGPFAVSLYRGATNLGEFTAPAQPPEDTAVQQVSQRRSQAQLEQLLQVQGNHNVIGDGNTIFENNNSKVGNQIAGDVHNPTFNQNF
jgi:hypothetical protein